MGKFSSFISKFAQYSIYISIIGQFIEIKNTKIIFLDYLSFTKDEIRKTANGETERIVSSRSWNPPAILDLFKPTESCALNKKGCHFPAAPADPSHTPSPPETSHTISAIFRTNFSRLNFDSGAKILGDIIKYDYPGKERRKGGNRAEMHRRGRGKKDAEKKQKEAAEVGRNDER